MLSKGSPRGQRISTSRVAHSGITNRKIHYNIGQQKNGVEQIESIAESKIFKKNQKVDKNEECTVTVKTATDQ